MSGRKLAEEKRAEAEGVAGASFFSSPAQQQGVMSARRLSATPVPPRTRRCIVYVMRARTALIHVPLRSALLLCASDGVRNEGRHCKRRGYEGRYVLPARALLKTGTRRSKAIVWARASTM